MTQPQTSGGIYPRETETYVYTKIVCACSYELGDNQKLETTQMSSNRRLFKIIVDKPHHRILLSSIKEWTVDTCNNFRETKDICWARKAMTFTKDRVIGWKTDQWLPGATGGQGISKGICMREVFSVTKLYCVLIVCLVPWIYMCVKIHKTVHHKKNASFTVW